MAVALTERELPQLAPNSPPRKRWTREEVQFFEDSGIFEYNRYELIEGELIEKMPQKRSHINGAHALMLWIASVFGLERLQTGAPIDVRPEDNPTSCPEPDLVVLSKPVREFRDANPGPADIVLAVEVSYSTVAFDLRTKGALYARAGIADYWVLDIPRRKLIVLREPLEGAYISVVEYSEGESVAPLAAPDSAFPVTLAFE